MKIIDCEQGTEAWRKARLGIPTASEFHRIITPAKGDLSAQATKYAHQLVAEIILGRALEKSAAVTAAMQRGRDLEPAAVMQYEFARDIETQKVGFVTTDDGRWGCSPDRMIIGERGLLEIKCTLDDTHVGIFCDGPGNDYKPQVQGQLLVAEAEWVDLYGFHPELPEAVIRTHRDEAYITKMRVALTEFCAMRDAMLAKVRAARTANDNLRRKAA